LIDIIAQFRPIKSSDPDLQENRASRYKGSISYL